MSEQLPAVATEIAVVEQQVGTAAYWRDEPLQARYRDLLDARDSGGAPPAPATPAARRIAELERMMRDPRSGYWRGIESGKLQAEYRQLVAADDNVPEPVQPGDWRATPDQARMRLPAAIVQEWDEAGAFNGNLTRLQNAAAVILSGIAAEGPARDFLAGFRALPEAVRVAVLREAGRPEAAFVKPATDAEMAEFRCLYRGAEVVRAWGNKARRNVAVALERGNRMHDAMSATDRAAFMAWLRRLPPRSRAAWWLGLAG